MSVYYEIIKTADNRLKDYKELIQSVTDNYKKILFKNTTSSGSIRLGVKSFYDKDHWKPIKQKLILSYGVNPHSLPEYKGFSSTHYELKWNKGFKHANEYVRAARRKSRAEIDRVLSELYAKRRELYDTYLLTQDWLKKRDKCFSIHGFICCDCEAVPATDIHHRHYETLGNECAKNDLVPLCRNCHRLRHDNNSLMDKPE